MDKELKEQLDEEPVFYCKRCLSLKIKQLTFITQQDYCEDCGATDVGSTTIDKWLEMYRNMYGHEHIEKKELKWPYWC